MASKARELFDLAWDELMGEVTDSLADLPANSALARSAKRLLALADKAKAATYKTVRTDPKFQTAVSMYEGALIEYAAIKQLLEMANEYLPVLFAALGI